MFSQIKDVLKNISRRRIMRNYPYLKKLLGSESSVMMDSARFDK